MRVYFIIGLVALIIFFLLYIYSQGKKVGTTTEVVKQQTEQINEDTNIIEDTKKIYQRKALNKSISVNANLEWMRQNRCRDC